jgi:hypothetical protein
MCYWVLGETPNIILEEESNLGALALRVARVSAAEREGFRNEANKTFANLFPGISGVENERISGFFELGEDAYLAVACLPPPYLSFAGLYVFTSQFAVAVGYTPSSAFDCSDIRGVILRLGQIVVGNLADYE